MASTSSHAPTRPDARGTAAGSTARRPFRLPRCSHEPRYRPSAAPFARRRRSPPGDAQRRTRASAPRDERASQTTFGRRSLGTRSESPDRLPEDPCFAVGCESRQLVPPYDCCSSEGGARSTSAPALASAQFQQRTGVRGTRAPRGSRGGPVALRQRADVAALRNLADVVCHVTGPPTWPHGTPSTEGSHRYGNSSRPLRP